MRTDLAKFRVFMDAPLRLLWSLMLVYITYGICRVAYAMENWSLLGAGLSSDTAGEMLRGALLFDTSAILYTNALYALMVLLPVRWSRTCAWQGVARWYYVVANSLCAYMNLADAVYFQFTGRRTTMSVTQEFEHENNLVGIITTEFINHWYLVLLGIAITVLLVWGSSHPWRRRDSGHSPLWVSLLSLLLFVPLCIGGMRGGLTTAVRPITISNANQYVNSPAEAALILNTPFSIIRTIGKTSFEEKQYFPTPEQQRLFSALHQSSQNGPQTWKPNIVILIVESFGREYIGALNEHLDGGRYKGYTPFVDRLCKESLTFDHSFCNGRKSIDGMPSILSSIPMFVEPFVLTPASMNHVSGIAGELGKVGYESAFFHGAENGSMGFQAFARSTGFGLYYGMTEYNADQRFGGKADFDGTWAIWDEPFLQFYATKMSEMHEPFVTAVFTASSHHPFVVPEEYKDVYKEDGKNVIHKCIRYTDHALERFFETARKQPWFSNTIFVLTSDHTNIADHPEYKTDLGLYCSPIIIYDATGHIQPGRSHSIAQQIDIMPTLLQLMGYPNPYVAFGKDLLNTPAEDTWAVNYCNGIYQLIKGDILLQFDGEKVTGIYNFSNDPLLKHNLTEKAKDYDDMERMVKAIIQEYMRRMVRDELSVESD